MTGIPLEMLTGAGAFLLSAGLKIFAARQEAQAAMFKRAMAKNQEEVRERTSIREIAGWFGVTRRVIALSVVLAVVVVPLMAPIFFPFTQVGYCHPTGADTAVLFGLFKSSHTTLACDLLPGTINILPFHTHLVTAIAAFYFGGKVTGG